MSTKLVKVETYKYPRQVRYFYPATYIEPQPTADYFMLFSPAGAPCWRGKEKDITYPPNHSLNLVYPHRDYNIVLFWNPQWEHSSYYVNIALPPVWNGDICEYLDLDLDVVWRAKFSYRVLNGTEPEGVFILDRDEFEEHKIQHDFPAEIVERAERALSEVLIHIQSGTFPFDHSLLNWRPDDEMLKLADLPDSAAQWHLQP